MGFTDSVLKKACDKAFKHYDRDGSGALDRN